MPASLTVEADSDDSSARVVLHSTHHRLITDLRAGRESPRQPGDEHALLRVGGATYHTHTAIDAWVRESAGRGQCCKRGRCPVDAERLGALCESERGGVELVWPVGIPRAPGAPGVTYGTGDLQRILDLMVVLPHLSPVERPIGAVAEKTASLEPFRPEAQRHHGEVRSEEHT